MSCLHIEYGTIYTESGIGIEEPSVMFDKVTGVLHKYGSRESVLSVYDKLVKADKSGLISNDLIVFTFDEFVYTKEEIMDIMNRMIDTSDYCSVFYKKLLLSVAIEKGITNAR